MAYKDKEKLREQVKKWRSNNPEKVVVMRNKAREKKNKLYKENPEKYRNIARKSYANNREKLIKISTDYTKKKRQKLNEFKKGLSCCRCGENTWYCLDFHHRDPLKKELTIGRATAYSWKRLMKEIEKCDVLCANCHRKIHFELKQKLINKEEITIEVC